MEIQNLKLSKKQWLFFKILNDDTIVDILFGGGAGGAKSLTVCLWAVLRCRNYPGVRIGIGRKEISRLKQTTLVTLLREAHVMLGVKASEFRYNSQSNVITYINGSSIILVDLASEPSDPNFDKFGSLNLTDVIIEEAGEVTKKARDVFSSRKNRWKNSEYRIVGKTINTCNPSQNFLKQEYYKPYKSLGGGEYQKWENGDVFINKEKKTAYRAFVKSLAIDNPFIDPNYIETLKRLPLPERKRLLEGDWDYEETDNMVFKPLLLDRIITDRIESGTVEEKFIGVDIADTGEDNTIISLIEKGIITEQQKIIVDKNEAIGEQVALEIIKFAQLRGIDGRNAKQIGIDANGVGASTRDFLRSKGWFVKEFMAGAGSSQNFKNIRGEAIWSLYEAMDKGEIKIYSNLPTIDILREQLMAHKYSTEERIILINNKKELKQILGNSPDYAESVYIAFWVGFGDNNSKDNQNRIIF